ncbi:type IV secretory system conjugative DNA transfer family protein [Bacillus paralicheniformis]|uniref:VirD4-like conjugal transfer protein, CD1115 family n=1 Tax=Bacillus paralicheniformis TaxID=1648923 RepID=UPI003D1F4DD9
MAKKRKEKSRFVDGLIGLIFSLLVGYLGVVTLKTILASGEFLDNAIQPFITIDWLINGEIYIQVLVLVISFGMFVLFMNGSSKKNSGYKDASSHGAYGDATFSSIDDVREDELIAERKESKFSEKNPLVALGASEGIILGRDGDELVIIPPDSKLDNRNVYVVGSSGSAKGQAFVINNIINNRRETIIVTDPKGELFHLTSDIKRDQGYKVYQIDFLNLKGNRYNPLDYVTNDFESIKIATTISQNSGKDVKQDFFFNTAKDLLTGLIIYVTSDKKMFPKPNISKTVKGLFNKISADEEFLKNLCEEIGEDHPSYQYFMDASVATGNTRTSILQSFAQQTGIFSLGDVARLTEDSDINFYDLQEEKSILYVKIPVTDNPVPALTATFFDQLIDTLYHIGDQNGSKLKIPTIFLLDEFANIGKLNKYDNVLSTCRGYELSMVTIVQDFAQMEKVYSKEMSRIIANNHDTTLFLRTKDTETAKYFETLSGDTTIKYNTTSKSGRSGMLDVIMGGNVSSSRSTNEQYIKKPLVASYELLNMNPRDKCYVYMPGHVLELKKAYQSLIYKDFITKQDGFTSGGRPKYVYCYPENREKYIEKFGLKPAVEFDEKDNKLNKTNIDNEHEDHQINVSDGKDKENNNQEKTKSQDESLENIVSGFFASIQEKEDKKNEKMVKEQSDVKEDIDVIHEENLNMDEMLEDHDEQKESGEIQSDPEELISFLQVTQIKKTTELKESLENKRSLFKELDLTDDSDVKLEDSEIDDDELPM